MIDMAIAALRLVHIAAGMTALFVAPVAMVTAKGGPAHRRWGTVYFWMMAVVAVTAVPLGLWRPNYFLMLVAVFSFYFAFRGYRVLLRKHPERGEGARALDWSASAATFLASAALIVLGIVTPSPLWVTLAPVAIVFGIGGVGAAGFDMVRFVRPPTERMAWWFSHMAGMLGSYIATVSAFSVVNFDFLPTVARWLWPSVVGTPLIVIWIVYYKVRFARRAKPAAVAV
ncbi:MAG TPA: hypothetical protein VMR23_11115 [Candidatus Limnocylindria bacterium]|nr:hypothetical protein [Candidatus Limnocylindria bacterium]